MLGHGGLARRQDKVAVERTEEAFILTLPGAAPDPVASVVAIDLKGAPEIR